MVTRDILMQRRNAIVTRHVAELAGAGETDSSVDLVDVADAQWNARLLSTLGETAAAALDAIDAALARMDRGLYGICAVCGGEITRERLRALPEAVECADCAEFAESRTPRFTHRA
jgi:RNA polymerase-binding transcription factor DksA